MSTASWTGHEPGLFDTPPCCGRSAAVPLTGTPHLTCATCGRAWEWVATPDGEGPGWWQQCLTASTRGMVGLAK